MVFDKNWCALLDTENHACNNFIWLTYIYWWCCVWVKPSDTVGIGLRLCAADLSQSRACVDVPVNCRGAPLSQSSCLASGPCVQLVAYHSITWRPTLGYLRLSLPYSIAFFKGLEASFLSAFNDHLFWSIKSLFIVLCTAFILIEKRVPFASRADGNWSLVLFKPLRHNKKCSLCERWSCQ